LVNSSIPECHYTFIQIIGKLLHIKELVGSEKLPPMATDKIKNWTPEKFKMAEDFASRVQLSLKEMGEPTQLLFWGTQLLLMLPKDELKLKEELLAALDSLNSLIAYSEEVSKLMGLDNCETINESVSLLSHIQRANSRPNLDTISIEEVAWLNEKENIAKLIATGKRMDNLKAKYADVFIAEIWQNDWKESRLAIALHEPKWYKFLIGDYNKHKNKLRSFRKGKKVNYTYLEILDDLLEFKRLEIEFATYCSLGAEVYGKHWVVGAFNWQLMEELANYLYQLHTEIKQGNVPLKFIAFLQSE
jgi:hypothetical protein